MYHDRWASSGSSAGSRKPGLSRAHGELVEAYADLGSQVADRHGVTTSPPALGSMLIQQVGGVITLRTDGNVVDDYPRRRGSRRLPPTVRL